MDVGAPRKALLIWVSCYTDRFRASSRPAVKPAGREALPVGATSQEIEQLGSGGERQLREQKKTLKIAILCSEKIQEDIASFKKEHP